MSQGPFVGRNGVLANNSLTVANTSQVFIIANSSGIFVGANVDVTNDKLLIGNATVNTLVNSSVVSVGGAANVQANGFVVGTSVINASAISLGGGIVTIDSAVGMSIGNSTVNAFANSTIFKIGIITSNTTGIGIGSNVIVDSAHIFVGNATSNSIATQNGWSIADTNGLVQSNSTVLQNGSNVFLSASGLLVGNSTVNTAISATGITVNGNQLLPATTDIGITLGDGTNVIPTGQSGRYLGPYSSGGSISQFSIIGQQSGNVAITLYKASYSSFSGNTTTWTAISTTGQIALSSAIKNQGALSGTFAAGDILMFNVESAAVITQATVFLKTTKTS